MTVEKGQHHLLYSEQQEGVTVPVGEFTHTPVRCLRGKTADGPKAGAEAQRYSACLQNYTMVFTVQEVLAEVGLSVPTGTPTPCQLNRISLKGSLSGVIKRVLSQRITKSTLDGS